MPVVITGYQIDPAAPVPTPKGSNPHRLLRALRPNASFGYVEISDHGTPEDALGEVARIRRSAESAWCGSYEVLHTGDQPAPPFAADIADVPSASVMFVNGMDFPPDGHDAAFELWLTVNAYLVTKPGYHSHRLHRRTHDDAAFGLVNLVEWESVAAWEAAHDEGFRRLAVRPDMPFVGYPTLCEPVLRQPATVAR